MKDKVLLIGNGPCVFDAERGQEIDDFDGKIVRCNNYKIEGYEKYVGTRTDIYVLGMLNLTEQLKPQYDYILFYLTNLDGGAGIRKIQGLSPHNKVTFFPIKDKDKIHELIDYGRHVEPSTGIVAMYWFTRPDIELFIYGFDFFTRGNEYFSTVLDRQAFKCHDPAREKIYVDFLIENEIVKWF